MLRISRQSEHVRRARAIYRNGDTAPGSLAIEPQETVGNETVRCGVIGLNGRKDYSILFVSVTPPTVSGLKTASNMYVSLASCFINLTLM